MRREFADRISLFAVSEYLNEEIDELKNESLGLTWPDAQIRVSLNYDESEESLEYVIEAYADESEVIKGNAVMIPDQDLGARKEGKISLGLDELFSEYESEDNTDFFREALMESVEDSLESPVKYEDYLGDQAKYGPDFANIPATLSPFKSEAL